MFYYDSHVHTNLSHDGVSQAFEYELAAQVKNVKGITYTEHFDIYDGVDSKIKPLDIQHYINNYNSIKHKVDAHLGLEVGLRPDYETKTRYELGNYIDKFDFLIGSSHIICNKDVAYDKSFFAGDEKHPPKTPEEAIQAYFEEIYENIRIYGDLYDVYGHLDHIVRYTAQYYGPKAALIKYNDYKAILDDILNWIIKADKGLEINTSGLRKGLASFHPNEAILQKYHDLGGVIVTTGSDAHQVAHLAGDFDKAYDVLERCGFEEVATYEKRNPIFRRIKDLRK